MAAFVTGEQWHKGHPTRQPLVYSPIVQSPYSTVWSISTSTAADSAHYLCGCVRTEPACRTNALEAHKLEQIVAHEYN